MRWEGVKIDCERIVLMKQKVILKKEKCVEQ